MIKWNCRLSLTWASYFRHFWILTAIHDCLWTNEKKNTRRIHRKKWIFMCWRRHSHYKLCVCVCVIKCDSLCVCKNKNSTNINMNYSSNWKWFFSSDFSPTVTCERHIFFSFRPSQYTVVITLGTNSYKVHSYYNRFMLKCICTAT